jgi:L-ascorbate metabolism protein UlaG (beta-lactamase superfamily)
MDITWLGHSCFLIRGKEKTIITDPCHPDLGYRLGEPKADIVTLSHFHLGHSYIQGVTDDPIQIKSPGEYEIGGTSITGVASFHDDKKGEVRGKNTIYIIEMDDITLCHLGDLGHPLDSHLVEEIGDVGILFLPVGEVSTVSIDTAMEIVRQLEPPIVIPMHYKTKAFTGNLSPVDKFLDAMRIREFEAKPKLSITSSSLPSSTQTIVLNHL